MMILNMDPQKKSTKRHLPITHSSWKHVWCGYLISHGMSTRNVGSIKRASQSIVQFHGGNHLDVIACKRSPNMLEKIFNKYFLVGDSSSPRFWKVTTNIQGDHIIHPMGIYAPTFILFLVQDSLLMSFHKVVFLVGFRYQHYWPCDWRYTIWASYALDF